MPSISPTATIMYSSTIAAVITIAVNIILSRKLWEKGNKSQDEGILRQGHANTPQPQLIDQDARDKHNITISIPPDHSVGDEGQLCVSVPSQTPPTTSDSEPQFIGQNVRDKNISVPAQASTTTPSHGDIGSEDVPSITLSQGSSNFQISETNATIIRNDDGELSRIQRNLACDYIANLHITWPDTNNDLRKHALPQSIMVLRAEAVLNDYQNNKSGFCFKDMRVSLLRDMANYVTGPFESRMYILSGLADTGKSTVAYTIASRAADLNLLGASFVFSQDEANGVERFFLTIAYQLCVYNETFANAIGDALKTKGGSEDTREYPQDQLQSLIQELILDPLRSIVQSRSRPTLIVVDALDECDEKDAFSVLTGLSQLVQHLPSFKVILTTRPQPYLDRFLSSQAQDGHTFLHLQDIENKDVDGDIRLYLEYILSTKQVQKLCPKCQWCPSDEEIDSLVCIAGKFFFIASMAARYILNKSASNPAAQIQKLRRAYAQDYIGFKDLNRFYTVMLRDVVPEDCGDDDIVSRYQSVVGTIMSVQHPLPVSALAHLIGIDVEEIHAVLDKIQSVILLGDDDVPCMSHKSFPEYLTDQSRCKDFHLRIDPGARSRHTQIATRCFKIMNRHLKRNILGLGDPARFMNNEDGLKEDGITDEKLKEKMPQQLRYACVYWVNHLEAGNTEDADLMNGLKKFLAKHVLHWFEVLSLIGKLDSAKLAILKLLKSHSHQLLSDALRFLNQFYEIIKRSALHAYYSALPFAPIDSFLYRRHIKEAEHNICAIEGGLKKWGTFVAKLEQWERVQVIRFSSDNTLLVSCSEGHVNNGIRKYGELKIWNTATCTPISTILGDEFAVTNDFSTIASSKNNTAALYNPNGSPSSTNFTTSLKIQKLALSSESSRFAAALSDGTVLLWNSRNVELIDSLDGFEDRGDSSRLEFSSTGTRLAYSSAKGIQLRDGINGGRYIVELRCGSRDKFEFLGDGSRIVSLSPDDSLTLWNSESGRFIREVRNAGSRSLAISANGSLIATNGDDKVTLWRVNDSLVQIKVLQVDEPSSMIFSLNSILAIATCTSVKLYNVKTHTFIHSLPFYGFQSVLAFSPDCTRLAAFSNGTKYLWDLRGIDASGASSKDATCVTAVALSRDCSRLACGFGDGTVELRDTSPTKRRIASHQAHKRWVEALVFAPDGELFASSGDYGSIKLWNGGDGSLRGTLEAPSRLESVALSNSVLVATGDGEVTLWSLDTLSLTYTFKISKDFVYKMSIAEHNTLIAIAHSRGVSLVDAENHRPITTFDIPDKIHTMAFLPDNLHLVALSEDGVFLSFNLINKHVTKGAALEHLTQLPNISLWRGVPIWHCQDRDSEQHYFVGLFSQHKSPVPVLWIPGCIDVTVWTQGSSMITLVCHDGRVILLRIPTSHVG